MADRYYLEGPSEGDVALLTGAEAQHLLKVMRARVGDPVVLFDGTGVEYQARVRSLSRNTVELELLARSVVDRELRRRLVVMTALPKGERQRWLIEKCVEMGVSSLVFFDTDRGVARADEGALERSTRYVIEASKQCGRNCLMELSALESTMAGWDSPPEDALRLLAHPGGAPIATIPPLLAERGNRPVWIAIGPEGGFTDEEVRAAIGSQWQAVDLGPRILRVETAAVLLAGLVASHTGV